MATLAPQKLCVRPNSQVVPGDAKPNARPYDLSIVGSDQLSFAEVGAFWEKRIERSKCPTAWVPIATNDPTVEA